MTSPGKSQWLSRLPFAGAAIGLIATLTHWFPNMNRVPYEEALPTISAVIGASLLVLIVLRPLAGGWVRAGLMGGIAAAYVLYLPVPVFAAASSGWLRAILLLLAGVAAIALARRIPHESLALLALNRKINMLLVPVAAGVTGVALFKQIELERHRPAPNALFARLEGRTNAASPDVWHLIFDRYGNRATLANVYRYDNSPFLAALRARGFAVNETAFSNYQRTGHSVASTLNASYLDALSEPMAERQFDWVPLYRSMTSNQALHFFRHNGYETYFAGSWWNPTRRSVEADHNVNYRALPELGRLVLSQSVAGFALTQLGLPYGDARAEQCERARHKFANLRELAGRSVRKYVFAHFLVPHPPFVLNADGSCRSLAAASAASRRDNYVAQIEYVNRETLRLVDAILSGPRQAVIVLHADEGPWPEPFVGDERFIGRDPVSVDWGNLSRAQLAEKMGVLMAVRHPGRTRAAAPATPVNVYPTLMRAYFASRGPNPAPRHFVFEGDGALYTFKDVTPDLR